MMLLKMVFTGYNKQKINNSITSILKNTHKYNILVEQKPIEQKIKDNPKIWGRDGDTIQKTIVARGTFSNMKNLIKETPTPNGILIEMENI